MRARRAWPADRAGNSSPATRSKTSSEGCTSASTRYWASGSPAMAKKLTTEKGPVASASADADAMTS